MDEDAVRAVVAAYFDRLNAEDFDGLLDLFADDGEVRPLGGRGRRGREQLRAYYRAALEPYPEHRDEPGRVLVSGSTATVSIRYEGRLANGRPISFDALNVYELAGGRIAVITSWYDSHAVRRDLLRAQAAGGPGGGAGGDPPRLGTVAEITPLRTRAALALARRGAAFRMDLPLDRPDPAPSVGEPSRPGPGTATSDDHPSEGVRPDPFGARRGSRWEALRQVRREDGTHYGDRAADDLGIDLWRDGIVTRAVLLDLESALGLACNERREITPRELERCAEAQGVELRPGDALLLCTGWLAVHLATPAAARPSPVSAPGLAPTAEMAGWLAERRLAAVAADAPELEATPCAPGSESLHARVVPDLGLAVGALWWLEDLRQDCRADEVWEGALLSVPLNLPGGCASPANAVVLK